MFARIESAVNKNIVGKTISRWLKTTILDIGDFTENEEHTDGSSTEIQTTFNLFNGWNA